MRTLKQRYLYKTKEKSDLDNLVNFGARYYDPLVGRFTTPDPMGMVDGPSRHLYCNGDPLNYYDEWGEWIGILRHILRYVFLHFLNETKSSQDSTCGSSDDDENTAPTASVISLSGAVFSPYFVGIEAGIEVVYIYNKGWVVYFHFGPGIGIPGSGIAGEVGTIFGD